MRVWHTIAIRYHSKPKCRRAFTLVELLVVIAIIGILVGLLLPAVQAAREAARRCSCANNLGQLGLAVHHYEFNREHLPAGVINDSGPIQNQPVGQHISWMVNILPYIEQTNIYRNIDQKLGAYAPENEPARIVQITSFQCPSDSLVQGTKEPDNVSKESSYAGCYHDVEAPIDRDNNGLLFLNSKLRFNEILDGSSNTILLGEKFALQNDLGWMSGTNATLRNTAAITMPARVNSRFRIVEEETPNPLAAGGFGSYHTGGGSYAFADGGIRFISQSIDIELYQNLGNRNDGAMIGGSY